MPGLSAGLRASRARLKPPCVRVVLWIAPPSDLFIVNVDKHSNYVRNDRSTNLVYLFDEAPGLRDIKVTHVEDCWLGRFNLLFKVDNLRMPKFESTWWTLSSPQPHRNGA